MSPPTAMHPPLNLGSELHIVHAAALREQLLAHITEHIGPVHLDLRQASDVDSSTVQLLLALRRSLQARGESLVLVGASPAVVDALTVYGLQTLFDHAPAAA